MILSRPTTRLSGRPTRTRRRGIASVLSMLYLVLFSTLAVGFAAATAMNGQISKNERLLQQADSAADGGMQFIRYQLGILTIAPTVQTSGLLDAVATGLATQLNGTANMNGHTVQNSGGVVYLPSATDWTSIDPTVGTRFRVKITQSGQFLIVTVDGAGPTTNIVKALQIQYQKAPKAGAILDYGVATEGTLTTAGATTITGQTDPTKGSVLSADMVSSNPINIGGTAVSGDISVVNPNAIITVSGASVGGTTDPVQIAKNHEHFGVPAPTFPFVDTSVYTAYATTPYDGSGTCNNCYIPAGTNPKFTGGAIINGVMLVQAPNVITFKGNATICGVIVSETGASAPVFSASANVLNFAGNVTATPINQMATTNPAYNADLVKLTGSFMLAPNFAVNVTGNFGTIGGSVVVGQLTMSGNAGGIVQGSVIGMQDAPLSMNGSSDIVISSTGTSNYPSGMSFGNNYTPLPGTYVEVQPW